MNGRSLMTSTSAFAAAAAVCVIASTTLTAGRSGHEASRSASRSLLDTGGGNWSWWPTKQGTATIYAPCSGTLLQ